MIAACHRLQSVLFDFLEIICFQFTFILAMPIILSNFLLFSPKFYLLAKEFLTEET